MTYAILDGTTITKTGSSIRELFKNVSFPASGIPDSFLTANNVVKVIETLNYTPPTQKLTKVNPYVAEDGKCYSIKVDTCTEEEKNFLITSKWSLIRFERDELLKQTDWRASSDLTLSDAWRTYRAELRSIPQTQADPFNITWPTPPS
tara:strand:- start:317 stop:760 length:444 start_codon:yes stop_codon:yes gene_type:complete